MTSSRFSKILNNLLENNFEMDHRHRSETTKIPPAFWILRINSSLDHPQAFLSGNAFTWAPTPHAEDIRGHPSILFLTDVFVKLN